MKKKIILACALLLAVAGGYSAKTRWDFLHRLEAPKLSFPDLDGAQASAVVTSTSGAEGTLLVRVGDAAPQPLKPKDPVFAPSEMTTQKNSQVGLKTTGDFFVSLEGDGVFGFVDARTNADRNQRSTVWNVQKGTFRIKSFERDGTTQYWIEVRVPHGTVRLRNGELGMNLGADGHGTIWLTRGEAEFRDAAGNGRLLPLKGLDRI